MALLIVLLETKMVTVDVDVLKDVMILMPLKPSFFPIEGDRVVALVVATDRFLLMVFLN